MNSFSATLRLCGLILFTAALAAAQLVPAPKDTLGFTPGDDRKLASWTQIVDYFKKLDAASDRMVFQEIGKTTMGAPFVYATISSPENLKNLDRYKDINEKLADPRWEFTSSSIPRNRVRRYVRDGKTIVLITCGIHSTEVGSTLSSMLIAHKLASSNEPEIQNILKNTIILLVPSLNPDGVDIIKKWYDKTVGTKFEGTEPPELYHKYVGHDNNRDWYAFTQVETQLTVDKIHNVWHPQIVHDIHQQGQNGSRLFLPPYMQPVEPNVPKQIVEGFTELGNAMAADLRSKGFQGITTNSTYDAWTPARAYSHYHGGVRILSETASARLATPVTKKFEDLRVADDDGYDPKKESANFGPLWLGGDWKLRNITEYMTTAAFSLLNHTADNREKWLTRFHEIGRNAVRPRKEGELFAYVLPELAHPLENILRRGGVEIKQTLAFKNGDKSYPDNTKIVRLDQPYGDFAKALFERQTYPNLVDEKGNPLPPYDVTAHTLPLLFGITVEPIYKPFPVRPPKQYIGTMQALPDCVIVTNTAIYRSSMPVMDEGWTRWILGTTKCEYGQAIDKNIRSGSLFTDKSELRGIKRIIFPDQGAAPMLNGYAKDAMPDELTGGIGKEGVENLKKFVETGGTLVFLNRASNFAIEQFDLPVKDVTRGLNRKDFYIPGSILRTELDLTHPIAKGMPQESVAWFENSPAFELSEPPPSGGGQVRIIARYPVDPKNVLLSGWALGAEKIAGKAALVSVPMGKGQIVLFGFRPQYRGQSLATLPLLLNAIRN